jgi:hypothetical protein
MAVQPWRIALLVAGGIVVGVGIAGLPTQQEDPPLQVRADATTTTEFTTITTAPPATTSSSTSTTAGVTSTTRRRP